MVVAVVVCEVSFFSGCHNHRAWLRATERSPETTNSCSSLRAFWVAAFVLVGPWVLVQLLLQAVSSRMSQEFGLASPLRGQVYVAWGLA